MELNYFLKRRFENTFSFLSRHVSKDEKILDLGIPNQLSAFLKEKGYQISNTQGEDLDEDFTSVMNDTYDVVTSFEVFEHLLAPYNILKRIKAGKLVTSVPLHQFFAKAYWNENDERDRHFHEFEQKQFFFLLEKTGWKIKDFELKTAPVRVPGIRPILRLIVPRYLFVYCER
jgi:hypothetical protein